jgi:hypothetical protein
MDGSGLTEQVVDAAEFAGILGVSEEDVLERQDGSGVRRARDRQASVTAEALVGQPASGSSSQDVSNARLRARNCRRTSRRTPGARSRCASHGSVFHLNSLTCVKRVPTAVDSNRYCTSKIDVSSSSRRTSRCGASTETRSTISTIVGRSGIGLW